MKTRSIILATAAAVAMLLPSPNVGSAATIYIGDSASAGQAVTDLGGAETSASAVSYAFPTDAITNSSGGDQGYTITEVNFWSELASGTVTPFVAIYNGGSIALGASFNVISVGDPIAVSAGVNNATYTPRSDSSSSIVVADTEVLIAGFLQSDAIVPRASGGDADYLSNAAAIPAVGTLAAPLAQDAGFSTLLRDYSFNIGLSLVVPEPSTLVLAAIGLFGLGFIRPRRRRRA